MNPSVTARALPPPSAARERDPLAGVELPRELDGLLASAGLWPLRARSVEILQLNLGLGCNLRCAHCHVDAGPGRPESMSAATMRRCLDALASSAIPAVDITGGAPELHPGFRALVEGCRALGRRVTSRCNLAVLERSGCEDLPRFFAQNQVELICSLPAYERAAVDAQRGRGVFDASVRALRRLNDLGYGDGRSGLQLVLAVNPAGPELPLPRQQLEPEWRRALLADHGVRFDALICLANMPVGRFLRDLEASGRLGGYLRTLAASFNPEAARGLACRDSVCVGWDGALYDCDFNHALGLAVDDAAPRDVRDFDLAALEGRAIRIGRHCFACTAATGSG